MSHYTQENFQEWIFFIDFKMTYFVGEFVKTESLNLDDSVESLDELKNWMLANFSDINQLIADTDTFEFFKYMIKMWIAVWLVSHAFTFSMAVFDVAQHLVNQAAGVINTSATVSGDQIVQMVEGLKDKGLGELVMILFETSLVKVAIQVMSVVIMLVVYGRMFEIYVYCSVSAIPFATMGNKEWGQIGTNYIKGLFAIGLQGLFLIICLGIYAVLVKTIKITDIHASIFMILGYALLLGLMMLKSGTLAKSVLNAH